MKHIEKQILPISAATLLLMTGCQGSVTPGDYDNYPVYEGEDLELTVDDAGTHFTLWSPAAEAARVNLYDEGVGGTASEVLEMKRDRSDAVWRASVDEPLYGKFYTFSIKQEGEWLDETPGVYARAVGLNGHRAAIIDWEQTNPEGWEADQYNRQNEKDGKTVKTIR